MGGLFLARGRYKKYIPAVGQEAEGTRLSEKLTMDGGLMEARVGLGGQLSRWLRPTDFVPGSVVTFEMPQSGECMCHHYCTRTRFQACVAAVLLWLLLLMMMILLLLQCAYMHATYCDCARFASALNAVAVVMHAVQHSGIFTQHCSGIPRLLKHVMPWHSLHYAVASTTLTLQAASSSHWSL
jgi:hypothetical protein